MYAVAVCEDQKDTREEAAALCGEVLTDLEIEHRIAAFSSAEDLETQLLSGERFDLLCLDILMDGESGMEFAKKLRMTDDRTSILFLTGSSEYLKDGYEVRPIQYLLKPVKREELARAIETDLRLHHQSKTVSIHVGGRTFVLPIADILYAESREHGAVLHTIHGEQFLPYLQAVCSAEPNGGNASCRKFLPLPQQFFGKLLPHPGGQRQDGISAGGR